MEKFILDQDLKTMYVKATSFPEGIAASHEKLHSVIPYTQGRIYFGISAPDRTGTIQYKAAALELVEGEAEKLKLDTFIIKKGTYLCTTVLNHHNNTTSIGKAFEHLIHNPEIDPQGECVEWYFNETDVRCMVRLADLRMLPPK